MPIDRPNVFGQGAATNTDLYIDASTKRLGDASRVISFYGHNPDADAIPEYVTFNGVCEARPQAAIMTVFHPAARLTAHLARELRPCLLRALMTTVILPVR